MKAISLLLTGSVVILMSCCGYNSNDKNDTTSEVMVDATPVLHLRAKSDSIELLKFVVKENLSADSIAFGVTKIGSDLCSSKERATEWVGVRNMIARKSEWKDSIPIDSAEILEHIEKNLAQAAHEIIQTKPNAENVTQEPAVTMLCDDYALGTMQSLILLIDEVGLDPLAFGFSYSTVHEFASRIMSGDLAANNGALLECWPCDMGLNNFIKDFKLSAKELGISPEEYAQMTIRD